MTIRLRYLVLWLLSALAVTSPASAEPLPAERLVADFGYAEDALVHLEDVQVASGHVLNERADAAARAAQLEPTRARLRERAKLLGEFAAETVGDADDGERTQRVLRLAAATGLIAATEADLDALKASETSLTTESNLLGDLLSALEAGETDADRDRQKQIAVEATLVEQEEQAKAAALEARKREEATKDEALRQLLARERELRDELVTIATARRAESLVAQEAQRLADEFTATKGRILGEVDGLPAEPTKDQRVSLVDPLLREILDQRRRLWTVVTTARAEARGAAETVAAVTSKVDDTAKKVEAERARKSELGGSELWKQRVKVAETELELAQAQLSAATTQHEQADARVALLEEGIEFYSKELREVVDRASSDGSTLVYGLLNNAAWSDALERLNDKVELARRLVSSRIEAGRGMSDQWLQLGLWLGGLFWRVFLGLVLPIFVVLRLVPAVTRRLLSALQELKFFRRRASFAVKIYEVLRTSARPAILYAGTLYVAGYIVGSFNELVFLQWGVDAFFIYFIGVRLATTLALPRWYREKEGMASTGGEDDLRPDESAIADWLRLDFELGTKFVRSARIILLVGTVWYFGPQIVVAITGVSVLSGLIKKLIAGAILLVVYWMLSTFRDELSRVFTKIAGNRLPKATAFVDRNKDRPWGVLVVAVVSVVVVVDEVVKFVRRVVLNTEWFKVASAYAFKTKIELQQRDEPTDAEVREFLPDDLEAAFSPRETCEPSELVERESMTAFKAVVREFVDRGHGALCLVGEPGVGKSTSSLWALDGCDVFTLDVPQRISTENELVSVLGRALTSEFASLDEVVEALLSRPSTTFLLDGLEHLFLRDIDGYGAYRCLMSVLHQTNRQHVWLVTVNRFAWDFLTRVYDQRHVFQSITTIPRWADEELRAMVERRMAGLPYTTSFTQLADIDSYDSDELVKTSRGYYRYLAEFTRGNPSTAMHYWTRSLSGGTGGSYSVGLFNRPAGSALTAAPSSYRFVLAAIAQHGSLTPAQAARVDNVPIGTCELAAEYFVGSGAVHETDFGYELTPVYLSVSVRHLEDSNLL